MITYEFHPIASIFPMLEERDLDALSDDIKAKGLTEPITLYEGKILDGRNRYLACDLAKVELRSDQFIQYEGNDALGFVISKNLRRRHLDESQRAMIAAKIANMTVGGDHSANLQNGQISQSKAAEMMNVSTRSVGAAKTIEDPDLQEAVISGKTSVHAASKEQIARGTTKKGSASKSGTSIDDKTRAAATKRERREFWAAFRKQLNDTLVLAKAAIERFETDPEGHPGKGDWDVAVQLSQEFRRLHDLHTG